MARPQVLELQCVLPVARRIGRKRQNIAVIADIKLGDRKILQPFRHLVLIQKDDCVATVFRLAAKVCRILLALLGLCEIPVIPFLIGNTRICLLDPPDHFIVERIDQRLMLPHKGLGVFVFRGQIIDNGRILDLVTIAEPGVVVGDLVTMDLQDLRDFFCDGWFHICLGNDHCVADYDNDKCDENTQQTLDHFTLRNLI